MKRMNKAQTERLQARIAVAQTSKINKYKATLGTRPELTSEEQAELYFNSASTSEMVALLTSVASGVYHGVIQRKLQAQPKVAAAIAKVVSRRKTWDAQVESYSDKVREEAEALLDTLIFNGDAEEIFSAIAKFERS